jgi:hypothetical protein
MKMDISKLVKISTYARQINKSVQWVHKLAEQQEIKLVTIDGVKFVKLS